MLEKIDVHSRRLISGFSEDGVKGIEKIQSHCTNMNVSGKSRYARIFQQFTHKGEESSINCIKIFQNAQALSVSVIYKKSEEELMHIFLDNVHQGGK